MVARAPMTAKSIMIAQLAKPTLASACPTTLLAFYKDQQSLSATS
jgi:hypothetical protein